MQSTHCFQGRALPHDDPAAPTSILRCGAICDEVLARKRVTIEVVLGCETRPGPVNWSLIPFAADERSRLTKKARYTR